MVEHELLIFQDADSLAVNNYEVGVLYDKQHMFRPNCTDYTLPGPFEKTMTHCSKYIQM